MPLFSVCGKLNGDILPQFTSSLFPSGKYMMKMFLKGLSIKHGWPRGFGAHKARHDGRNMNLLNSINQIINFFMILIGLALLSMCVTLIQVHHIACINSDINHIFRRHWRN